ncbi:Di-copper centre-containing protein [Hyaloscypha hepaticicola]|uniref:Di-copper centre-containing protein n=1 Tax=Hyaloscypha hepaticicola TaxID=2082293 RepID=A0A2J6PH00_9HELO|nr:Di-copper centre-containing protein [Hyaloscypha hepaticicola]
MYLCELVHSTTFSSYNYGDSIDRNTITKRQQPSSPFVVTGVQTSRGPTPLRLEVRQLEQDPTLWTLYILGLDMLQYTNQTEMLSWYQITGIHGRPFTPFDNVQPVPGNGNNGYCTHVSILFPAWHRPYLAFYEQILYNLIQQIAQLYPAGAVRNQYVAAAANFRIPYWDWAAIPPAGQSVFPSSVGGSPSVVVDGPVGNQTIANPLWSYQFKPLVPSDLPDKPFNQYQQTMRYPTTGDSTARSQNNLVAQQLDNSAPSFRQRLYSLFTNYHSYQYFSNEAWFNSSNDPNGYDSIESVHDQIHGLTGGGGHMSYIDYSAFDPAFWLHHAMIDRCFAMWQVLNPGSYVTPEPATYNTFTNYAGQMQDVNSALTPFYTDSFGSFWTSAEVVNTTTFGYAYAETSGTTNAMSQVITAINKLYRPGEQPNSMFTALKLRDVSGTTTEWIANIQVKKFAINAPFFVHIFLGTFNPDPASWSFDPNLVGTHFIFVKGLSAITNSCGNCDPDQMVSGTIPLTHALLKYVNNGDLKSLDPGDVTPFLSQNLKYRITLTNDTEVSNADVPSLKISVVSANVQTPVDDTKLPVWSAMKEHMDVSTA